MLYKYLFSNSISQERRLYILLAIALPFAVAATIWAWAEGNLFRTILYGTPSAGWGIAVFFQARNIIRRREASKRHHVAEKTHRLGYKIVFERALWFIGFALGATILIWHLYNHAPTYTILGTVWYMIMCGGHFLFVALASDE